MNAQLSLMFWSTLLSLIITYWWWTKFRVWMFRQDLFEIRDGLWLQMHRLGRLDDPAYQETRDALNSIIRIAPSVSFLVIICVLFSGAEKSHGDFPQILEPVEDARNKLIDRAMRFAFKETLLGLAILGVSWICRIHWIVLSQFAKWMARFVDSEDVRRMARSTPPRSSRLCPI